jgi:hypothetical protein
MAGAESLGDAELVAVVLGAGGRSASLAKKAAGLVDELGMAGLARAGVGELSQRTGIGPARAVRLVAAIELGRRAMLAAALEAMPCLPGRVYLTAMPSSHGRDPSWQRSITRSCGCSCWMGEMGSALHDGSRPVESTVSRLACAMCFAWLFERQRAGSFSFTIIRAAIPPQVGRTRPLPGL